MTIVLDYQNPKAADGAALVAADVAGVVRYTYNLTIAELKDLWDHGIDVGVVFEHYTTDWQGGYDVGKINGAITRGLMQSWGFPDTTPGFCAVDTRLNNSTRPVAVEYNAGFRDGCGAYRPYGESALIDACVTAGLSDLGWCPETWDNTNSPNLCLIQRFYVASPISSTDRNDAVVVAWGGWQPGAAPIPPPQPPPQQEIDVDECGIVTAIEKLYALKSNADVPGQLDWIADILSKPRDQWAPSVAYVAHLLEHP